MRPGVDQKIVVYVSDLHLLVNVNVLLLPDSPLGTVEILVKETNEIPDGLRILNLQKFCEALGFVIKITWNPLFWIFMRHFYGENFIKWELPYGGTQPITFTRKNPPKIQKVEEPLFRYISGTYVRTSPKFERGLARLTQASP